MDARDDTPSLALAFELYRRLVAQAAAVEPPQAAVQVRWSEGPAEGAEGAGGAFQAVEAGNG